MSKFYPCEIPNCLKQVIIRSTIKIGKFKGKKCCISCKNKYDPKPKVFRKTIKKTTEKNLAKRKTERAELPEFFSEAIKQLKVNPYCQNCGVKMKIWLHPINRVAHLLSKRTYKSVMTNPFNRVFLCSPEDHEDGRSCHYDFDNKIIDRPFMGVFEIVMIKYRLFKDDVLETGKEKLILDNEL